VITTDYLVSCQEPEQHLSGLAQGEIAFLFAKTPRQLNLQWLSQHPDLLNYLVVSVSRQPRNLVTHIQRICLCYQRNMSDHLYGAMVDFFSVLNGHGDDFGARLLNKVQPKLLASHAYLLSQYLQDRDIVSLYLVQSSFTVLGKGLLGTSQLMTKLVEENAYDHSLQDPLIVARDYIEYSQFQEAKSVLESAILAAPTREELHLDLLELYKSLQDVSGFLGMYELLTQQGNFFPEIWDELKAFFSAKNML
jgi:hypothetical protein